MDCFISQKPFKGTFCTTGSTNSAPQVIFFGGGARGEGGGGTNWALLSQLGSQTKHLQDLRLRYSLDYTLDASN